MYTTQVAILVDKFHLTIDQIGNLTQFQIQEIYFHARDKNGSIVLPESAIDDDAEELNNLFVLRQLINGGYIAGENTVQLSKKIDESLADLTKRKTQ